MSNDNLATVLDVAKHPEFSEPELNRLFSLFCKYANPSTKKGVIELGGMKQLLQDLDLAQTHLEAKQTYEKYSKDGSISLDSYMRLVKDLTAKNGTISLEAILKFACQDEVSVDDVGVGGAKRFFEAKAKVLEVGDAAYRAFEDKKKQEEERKIKKEEFKKKMEHFQNPQSQATAQPTVN
ncbi:UNVERIFIED_CONTAM: hypothetical protein RMT77_013485 [Armadillidium vulgare]